MVRRLAVSALLIFMFTGCGERTTTTSTETGSSEVPVSTGGSAASTQPPDDVSQEEAPFAGDPTGAYFLMNDLPADFGEIDHLLLATIDENAEPAPLNGFIRPKVAGAPDYVLVQPSIRGTRLAFTTIEVKGVRYAFEGQFEVTGNFAADPPDPEKPVLTGTLTKMRDGSAIATTPAQFNYQAGG